jgi:hypothetical protein
MNSAAAAVFFTQTQRHEKKKSKGTNIIREGESGTY